MGFMVEGLGRGVGIAVGIGSDGIESVVRFDGRICGVSPTPTMQYLSVSAPIRIFLLKRPTVASVAARPRARIVPSSCGCVLAQYRADASRVRDELSSLSRATR